MTLSKSEAAPGPGRLVKHSTLDDISTQKRSSVKCPYNGLSKHSRYVRNHLLRRTDQRIREDIEAGFNPSSKDLERSFILEKLKESDP